MKTLVAIKRVPDAEAKITVKPDGSGIVTDNIKWVINPFCEIALEEALRTKEKLGKGEVVLVAVGEKAASEQLRTGLAMGADRAILVVTGDQLDPSAVAAILAKVVQQESPNLVFLGKQAIDDDSNQSGQMLSALLDWPQACFASKVEIGGDGASAKVTREVDGGLETINIPLPAIITADLRLNEPRYASLPGIMKARKKELKEIPLADLGVDAKPKVKVLKLTPPPKRQAGKKVESVEELMDLLHTEAKVI